MKTQAEFAGAAFGRSIGALVTAFFGFIWFGWGFSALPDFPTFAWIILFAVAVAFLTLGVLALRRGKALLRAAGASRQDFWNSRRKPFRAVTLLEGAGCIAVVILANVFHRVDWIALGISLVVGLHFLPLGKILLFPAYYWTGSLIVACDLILATSFKSWNPTASAGISTGTILWVTGLYALALSAIAARSARHLSSP